MSQRTPSGPRRRTLLASTAGVVLLSGCSGGPDDAGATGSTPSAADRARARAARESRELAARYDAVMAAHPAFTVRLRPLRDATVRHAEAFGGTPGKASPTASASASPSASASASQPPVVPADGKEALAGLATAERKLADGRARALLSLPGELARLLASVAAAGAAHAYLLTEGEG
ncbi:lipoprotein [Streptomyces sp. AS58]|nr:lipoprotein [Streptomyces sp. AS58]